MSKKRYSNLQLILTVLSVACLMISNVITVKQIQLPFGLTMTGAIFIFPITYILSDVFSEVYGYKWSRITCYLGFAMNLLMIAVFQVAISCPSPSYWNNQEAIQMILGNTPRVVFASMAGLVFGDMINDKVFRRMKQRHENEFKGFEVRAILSSIAGECVDSTIFISIAFLGTMPLNDMIIMGATEVSLKIIYEMVILPLTTVVCRKVRGYEIKLAEA